jgi:YesN/AraC family two-component response regulator
LAQILTEHAVSLVNTDSIPEAVKIIGEAFKFSLGTNDIVNVLYLCRKAAGLYSRIKDTENEKQWLNKALFYSDSLLRLETSDQLMADKILLLTAQTERELTNSKIILDQNKTIITNQKRSIYVLIYFIIIILAFLGIVLYQRKKLNEAYHALVSRTLQIIQTEKRNSNYKTNPISSEQTSVLVHQLENLMETGNHFLDPDISITKLSKLMGTNEKYLSQLINQQLDTTFNDYINRLRIKEACRILSLPGQTARSLEQIALEAGFRSRSTFYQSFKKYTGVTPAFFQNNVPANSKNVL